MTELTRAIASHDLAAIGAVVKEHPEQIGEPVNGWLPIEWAKRTGNPLTYARVSRLVGPNLDRFEHAELLRKYLAAISSNYFGGGSTRASAERAWEQIHRRFVRPFTKELPDFVLDEEQKKDLEYLMMQADIRSIAALVALVTQKG